MLGIFRARSSISRTVLLGSRGIVADQYVPE
jgi:hypothetical protein